MQIINFIRCKIKGHSLKSAGSCPFTGKDYNVCDICLKLIEVNNE